MIEPEMSARYIHIDCSNEKSGTLTIFNIKLVLSSSGVFLTISLTKTVVSLIIE
jgi:hypothetical protein